MTPRSSLGLVVAALCLTLGLQSAAAQRSVQSEAERDALRAVVIEKYPGATLAKAKDLKPYKKAEMRADASPSGTWVRRSMTSTGGIGRDVGRSVIRRCA